MGGSMQLSRGTKLARYRIESLLGRGGMGEVYKAHDETLDRDVALKILRPELTTDPEPVLRFKREAKILSSLNHPHIVHVYDVGESEFGQYIAMEFVDGRTLREIGTLTTGGSQTLRYLVQVADALAKAHDSHIVHRDLKPENILVSRDGYAKVADFGLGKLIDRAGLNAPDSGLATADGIVMGTVGYMAPEQVLGKDVDARADIFAFGCILHEAFSGSRPFQGSSAFETMQKIVNTDAAHLPPTAPAELQSIVSHCMAKDPAQRYASIADVASDLRAVLQKTESGGGERTELLQQRAVSKVPRWFVFAAIAALIVFAGTVIVFRRISPVALPSPVAPQPPSRQSKVAYVPDSRAYDAYVHATVNISNENPVSNDKAIKLLQSAIALDPKFAAAYAQLARAYHIKSFFYKARADNERLEEEAQVAVEKALALDPNLAEAHLARGLVLWTHNNRFPHEEAVKSYKQALALNPGLDEAHHQLGVIYFHVGLFDKSWREIESTLQINPANTLARFRFGVIDAYRGHYDDALSIFKSTPLTKNPSLWAYQMANSLYRLGRTDEAWQMLDEFLKKYPNDEGGLGTSVKAMILADRGKRSEAEAAIHKAVSIGEGYGHFHHTAYNVATAYAMMKKPDEAIHWLQIAADDGFPCYPLYRDDDKLVNLRSDPRFIALLARLKSEMARFDRSF
jgi:tetratricopeptide (TPR) repeat protein/predicted Ser/Thr protein kinase